MSNIAGAIVFVGMLYFAFTYNTWDWWIGAVLLFSVMSVLISDRVRFDNKKEVHNHFQK